MYALYNGPFMEVSAGVENILKVLRFAAFGACVTTTIRARALRPAAEPLHQLLMNLRAENIFKRYKRRTVVAA
jgi:hypothetical protein